MYKAAADKHYQLIQQFVPSMTMKESREIFDACMLEMDGYGLHEQKAFSGNFPVGLYALEKGQFVGLLEPLITPQWVKVELYPLSGLGSD